MKTSPYFLISAVLFSLMALAHVLRLVQGWPVVLGAMTVPLWLSVVAILVCGSVAAWGFALLRKA